MFGGNASKDLLLARTQAAWEFWLTLLIGVKRAWKNTLMLLSQLGLQTALHDHHHCISDTKHDLDLAWHLGARSVFKWLDPVGLVICTVRLGTRLWLGFRALLSVGFNRIFFNEMCGHWARR